MRNLRGYTSIYFGENQLSPGLIGLSPLSTAHPSGFHPTPVRASTQCYLSFTLAMDRSPGFGSTPCDLRPIQTRFPFGFAFRLNLATESNSLTHYAKGTRSPAHPKISQLPLLVGIRFQVLFHSPRRGSFHLSLTVLVHYRSLRNI